MSQFEKFFDKLISNRIYSYVQKYNLLNEKRFGFRQNHFTIHAINHMYDSSLKIQMKGNTVAVFIKNTDEGKYSCCIFLDLSKAFNTINHRILRQKIKNQFVICGTLLELPKIFLSERQQYLNFGGEISEVTIVTCGNFTRILARPTFNLIVC